MTNHRTPMFNYLTIAVLFNNAKEVSAIQTTDIRKYLLKINIICRTLKLKITYVFIAAVGRRLNDSHGSELSNFAPDTHGSNWKSLITGYWSRSFFKSNIRAWITSDLRTVMITSRRPSLRCSSNDDVGKVSVPVMVARIKSRPCTSFHHESRTNRPSLLSSSPSYIVVHLFAYILFGIAHLYNENFFQFAVPSRRSDKRAEYEWVLFSFFTRLHPHRGRYALIKKLFTVAHHHHFDISSLLSLY